MAGQAETGKHKRIMAEIGPGDHKEWILVVLEKYERPLLRFAWRIMGNEESARDVVQNVFLKLCGQSQEGIGERTTAWLFAVCRNCSIDLLRKRGVATGETEPHFADCPGKEPDPAVSAEKADLHHHINRMVDELPLSQREAVALWAEGFTYREIAEVTKNNEGNIRVIVHRALKRLREHPFVVGQVSNLSQKTSTAKQQSIV
jgi:RNA polymerase sigma factor (sigma-70 family)